MLFESKRSRDTLDWVVKMVKRLRPGQRISVSPSVLECIQCERPWTPPDRVLENIMGSSFEFRYCGNRMSIEITFERLSAPLTDGRRSYVSPDRRHLYNDMHLWWSPVERKPREEREDQ